jgi:hypothetical protein
MWTISTLTTQSIAVITCHIYLHICIYYTPDDIAKQINKKGTLASALVHIATWGGVSRKRE